MFQRVRRLDSLLRNAITRLGTSKGRANRSHVSTGRYLMGSNELDALWTSRLMRRISTELPKDATTDVQILGEDLDTASIQRELDRLDVSRKVSEAAGKARHYGGAALWMTFEGGGKPDEELDMSSVKRVANIVTITRFELSISSALTEQDRKSQQDAGVYNAGFYDMNPRSPNYGHPFAYYYHPSKGGTPQIIHASRLIIMRGDPVPDHLSSLYQGWGAPLPESLYNTWAQLKQGQHSGAELLTEFGLMVYKFANLTEIMTGDDRPFLDEWMDLQNISKGLLRAVMLDTNVQDAVRMDVKAQGWSDIYDRIAQMFAAEAEMPVTKLYGQAPGGLSTDDASAWRNWSKTVATYQRNELSRVYLQILSMVLGSSMGPSGGTVPENLGVKFEPYEVPSQKEDADTVAVWTKSVIDLLSMGIIDQDEARDTMRAVGEQIAFKTHATEREEEGGAELSAQEASSILGQFNSSTQKSDKADITQALLDKYSGGSGLMVTIYPGSEFAQWLASQEFCSAPADELHLTLCYVPDVKPEDMQDIIEAVEQACKSFVEGTGRDMLEFSITGPSIFQNEEDAHVLLLGCVGLNALRFVVRGALAPWIREEKHDFIPHMTVAYKENGSSLHPSLTKQKFSGTFDASSVHVVKGDERHEITFK